MRLSFAQLLSRYRMNGALGSLVVFVLLLAGVSCLLVLPMSQLVPDTILFVSSVDAQPNLGVPFCLLCVPARYAESAYSAFVVRLYKVHLNLSVWTGDSVVNPISCQCTSQAVLTGQVLRQLMKFSALPDALCCLSTQVTGC